MVSYRSAKKKRLWCQFDVGNLQAVSLKMSASLEAPKQFSQPSRKGRKAWRKNVDITEVQEGLQLLRDEEIKG